MCKQVAFCWRPHAGCSNDEQVVRTYKVPAGLKWCPRCSKNDPDKMIAWMKHVCTELYKENEKISASLGFKTALCPFRDNLEELNGLYGSLARGNIHFRKMVAERLLDERLSEKIEIVAPFLTAAKKRAIKKRIDGAKYEVVEGAVAAELGELYAVSVEKANSRTVITVAMRRPPEESRECQVCFDAQVTDAPLCKTCRHCYTCKGCEEESASKYGRCAFCNTAF